ncbi:MAG: hypothetical protein WCX46_04045 [Candidatus Paceibacterota bacterium]
METNKIFEEVESRKTNNNLTLVSDLVSGNSTNPNWGTIGTLTAGATTWTQTAIREVTKKKILGITFWKKIREIPVDEFFQKIKKSKKEIKIIDDIIGKYFKQIEQATKLGQIALVEKLKDDIEVVKAETLAVVCGVTEYLTQIQVDSLIKKSSKNIEITMIKNFIRPIPEDLVELKEKLDKENVFSEYVILHYDPKKENTQLTKKEVERKKDPILFGIIKGSRNFYFLGDWVDEYCNLTLKEAVNIIGEKSKEITKKY